MKLSLPRTTAFDLPLLAVILVLLAVGIAMVYSASGIRALDTLDEPRYYLIQQSIWAVIGLAAMFVAAQLDYHRYRALAVPGLVIAILLLLAVLVPGIGTSAGGATRWIRFGPVGFQPAEIAKLALIVYLAFWLGSRAGDIRKWSVTVTFLAIVGGLAALIVAEPDLGTTLVVVAIAFAMFFVAGARISVLAALGGLAVVAVAAVAVSHPERMERLMTFIDPWSDPRGAGFQTIQALYGLALGGPFGEGLGAGTEKFGFLPAAYTDSIFAVLGNELGMLGTLSVVVLFLVFAFKGIRIALRAPDLPGALLAAGITSWIAFQAWLNMAVVASLVPLTGITLPFISYGGSSLCVSLIAVGILLNVGKQGAALADVPGPARGRRDGRPRQPAPRGRGSAQGGKPRRPLPLPRWSSRARG